MASFPALLKKIIAEAEDHKAKGHSLKAIFDLDSTLFDVSPRISKILQSFADLPEIRATYPKESEFLLTVEPHPQDYGVRKTLERYGVSFENQEFLKILVEYWKKLFFANEYLKYDRPYPGAAEYVTTLYKAGADIYYLTGRDVPRMREGTIQSLKDHRFPLTGTHSNLILKPDSQVSDAPFKKEFLERMDHSRGPVWFFENEPVNINLVLEHCPHIRVVFVETVHSQKAAIPPDSVPRIEGWHKN